MKPFFRFHIGEVSLNEVSFALFEARIKWTDWRKRSPGLQELVDKDTPVLHWDSVLQRRSLSPNRDAALWQHLLRTESSEEAFRSFQTVDDFGREIIATTTLKGAREAFRGYVEHWHQELEAASGILKNRKLGEEALFEIAMRAHIPPQLHELLDAFGRVWVRYAILYAAAKYNPYARKHKGDALDFYNLKLMAAPALICTADQRLKNIVRDVESWQEKWILTPAELIHGYLKVRTDEHKQL